MRPTRITQVGVGQSAWVPVDSYSANGPTTIFADVKAGGPTYSVEVTPDNPMETGITPVAYPCGVSALTGATTDASGVVGLSVRAVRLNVTVAGTVELIALQGGVPVGAGGGGGGDATAANQVSGNASLSAINGKLPVSEIVASNTTTTPLGISGVFTGPAFSALAYSSITVGLQADQVSATDGLAIQQSPDGVNWDSQDLFTIPASTGKIFGVIPSLAFARVVYTNGGVAQGAFRLQTVGHAYMQRGSVQRPQDGRTNDNDFDEQLSYQMVFNGTTWDRQRGDITFGMDVDVTRVLPGSTASSLGKAEDAVAGSGDTGVFTLAVQRDTLVAQAAAGDYHEFAVDVYGATLTREYEKQARTYSAAFTVTAAATPSDIAILNGSATTTVYVTKVSISGVQTTGGNVDVQLIKRSAANTGGTSTGMVLVPHDSTDAAATAAGLIYTANPTPGAAVGAVRRKHVQIPAAVGAVECGDLFEFGERGRPIILRGTAQGLAVNMNGATVTGSVFDVYIEFFEV